MIDNHVSWKENDFLRNRKNFYYSNGDNKAERDILKRFGSIGPTGGGEG